MYNCYLDTIPSYICNDKNYDYLLKLSANFNSVVRNKLKGEKNSEYGFAKHGHKITI